uniref:Uncharacterized protein n=1 Tax=Arundo donax TaxID=35708 RepID=A0A0A8ZLQ6_ARUDO
MMASTFLQIVLFKICLLTRESRFTYNWVIATSVELFLQLHLIDCTHSSILCTIITLLEALSKLSTILLPDLICSCHYVLRHSVNAPVITAHYYHLPFILHLHHGIISLHLMHVQVSFITYLIRLGQ